MELVRMGRSHILQANWYDYPQYYDIAFQAHDPAGGRLHRGRMPQVLPLRRPPVPGASLRQWPINRRVGRPRLPSDRLRSQPASVELSSAAACTAAAPC